MFNKVKKVIYLSKGTIQGVNVKLGDNPEILDIFKENWNHDDLTERLATILGLLKTKKVLLLLSEDLTYVTSLNIPIKLEGNAERKFIFEKLQTMVPEDLEDSDWDYRENGILDDEKKTVIFIPVKDSFRVIKKAFNENKCLVEAVEPVAVAQKRNEEPLIGIALKKDFQGRDSQVLNLSLTSNISRRSSGSGRRKIPVIIAVILFLTLGIAGGKYLINYFNNSKITQEQTAVINTTPQPVQASPTPEPTPTPTPLPELNLEEYSVNVLNGSGINGVAASVAELLKKAGFTKVTTGNAPGLFKLTVIKAKDSPTAPLLLELVNDILADYDTEEQEPLTAESDFDLLIIVGTN